MGSYLGSSTYDPPDGNDVWEENDESEEIAIPRASKTLQQQQQVCNAEEVTMSTEGKQAPLSDRATCL